MAIICIDKKEGELLHELIERVRFEYGISVEIPVTYAGRLDPLASGLVVLLSGEDVYAKDEYMKLPKKYYVEILLGVGTDTGDPLGIVLQTEDIDVSKETIEKILPEFIGTYDVRYPLYSSRKVDGVPLFAHAREGKAVVTPKHIVTIDSIDIKKIKHIVSTDLLDKALERIDMVSGDFRQEIIKQSWRIAHEKQKKEYMLIVIEVSAESGAYMRVLAEDIGEKLGVPSLAWRIVRLSVGEYKSHLECDSI